MDGFRSPCAERARSIPLPSIAIAEASLSKLTQSEKATALLALHHRDRRELLLLPNVWSPIGARILEAEGYPAVATASAALSASLGYEDGERIQRSTLIGFLARIAQSVHVPVTADIERGYGESLSDLRETVTQVIDAGVAGINLEDSVQEGGHLRPTAQQCERIAAVRQIADVRGTHLVINARIDCFLPAASSQFAEKSRAIDEAVARARAYADAGADCVYPIGPGDEPTVRTLRDRIDAPLNILASPEAASLSTMLQVGVNRVSFGPFVFRSIVQHFLDIARRLRVGQDHDCLGPVMSATEIGGFLRGDPE
jgi:2-methylisocitrate lyase-like PEP mutase family enzyme